MSIVRCCVDLSDLCISDIMSTVSDNFVGISVALTGQEDVFKIYFLTNEQVKSQYKDQKIQHKDI